MKWQELSATSHYQTAVAVEQALEQGDIPEAKAGIQELIDALSRSDRGGTTIFNPANRTREIFTGFPRW